jgi:biopolymer transport protein ExbD
MKKRTREPLVADFTPLIDVVFLLLIFFMVATVFKKDELALLLSLPESQQGGAGEKQGIKNIQVELTGEELAYNGKKLSFEELDLNLKTVTDTKTLYELRIDKDVKYERVVKILDSLKKYSLTNIELVTLK